jgi:hypothetical protein
MVRVAMGDLHRFVYSVGLTGNTAVTPIPETRAVTPTPSTVQTTPAPSQHKQVIHGKADPQLSATEAPRHCESNQESGEGLFVSQGGIPTTATQL